MDDTNTQNELERWREQAQHWHGEAERLRKELEARQTPIRSSDTTPLIENHALIEDLARYQEGLVEKAAIKKKWRGVVDEKTWNELGGDDAFYDAIEAEKLRRVRNGQAKRERAQQHITKAPGILDSIMSNPEANERHRIDAVKALDALADPGPQSALPVDKFFITIDLSGDSKIKDPRDILTIDATPLKTPATTTEEDDWKR